MSFDQVAIVPSERVRRARRRPLRAGAPARTQLAATDPMTGSASGGHSALAAPADNGPRIWRHWPAPRGRRCRPARAPTGRPRRSASATTSAGLVSRQRRHPASVRPARRTPAPRERWRRLDGRGRGGTRRRSGLGLLVVPIVMPDRASSPSATVPRACESPAPRPGLRRRSRRCRGGPRTRPRRGSRRP